VRADAGIADAAGLAGKRVATPQLGNTQDVALRAYLARNHLRPKENGGTVEVIPTPNAQIIDLMRSRQLDGAWVPEPWASRLVVEAECVVLVDERELWPDGDFVTAHLIVRTDYLEAHQKEVRAWLDAHVTVTQWMLENPAEAQRVINGEVERLTGKPIAEPVLSSAWSRMRPTWDPIVPSLNACAESAHAAGFLRNKPDLNGIHDLSLLNEVLRSKHMPEITD
jgi:NitT/TauT family transport system substrate-binding protein